jgi:hypothetical protein
MTRSCRGPSGIIRTGFRAGVTRTNDQHHGLRRARTDERRTKGRSPADMSQIFRPSANTIARVLLNTVLLVGAGSLAVLSLVARSDYVTGANVAREQPVQFSHAHHVGGMGIDCRYCHTSVERAAFANVPPTKTCMNCHAQIWADSPYLEPVRASFRTGQPLQWVRVNDLPDFVYFNHSIHVAKGVGCETCHGRVDRMPLMLQSASLSMDWCLNCHRQPERYLRPREAVTTMGWEPPGDQAALGRALAAEYRIPDVQRLTSCDTCHR